ncbi:MAG: Crp/Fnr family transcriptional regulator [Candidatus Thiodiazotropha lotti]|nr:Crp/Fnr family transcriptional regulator [Candidatus Thiodiazotropha lotti]
MNTRQHHELLDRILDHPRLREAGRKIHCAKGEHIFAQGEVCRDIFCMNSGLVKLYYNTREGKEWIKSFIADRSMLGSRTSQELGLPSPFSAMCLEDTQLVRFPYALFEAVCFSDLEMAKAVFHFSQWLGLKKELREYQLLCLTAEEAYLEFLSANPGLNNRLTQIDIARYLGITPIALSRIKSRISQQSDKSAVKPATEGLS